MEQPIISLKNLTKIYDGKTVVNNINLDIKKGEFVTFLGPSGCGKTTTLRMIAGFEKPNSGEVLFNGENIANIPPYKRNVNTVFQKYALFPHLNVYNNVSFGLKLQKVEKQVTDRRGNVKTKKVKHDKKYIDEKVKKALKIVGLTGYEKRDVTSLSGGQQQRVAIARAIVNEPEILLLDEPLGALDLKMRQEMQLELKSMHKKLGITFIYVTHDQEEALTMSDTIVVMRDGLIMQEGAPCEIYNDPVNAYVADFIGESNILDGIMLEDRKVKFYGKEFECVDEGFAANEEIDVVIRPEDIVLDKPGKGLIDGVITNSIFRGVHYEMTCKTENYELIVHNTIEQPVGTAVSVYVKPFDFHIMRKERYCNTIDVEFIDNTQLEIYGAKYTFDPTSITQGISVNENGEVFKNGEPYDFTGKKGIVKIAFTAIDLTDSEDEAPLAGNVYSMIYKGKNYLVTIRTDDDKYFYADTEYLWDDGDRVGIAIKPTDFRLESIIDEE